MDKTITIGVKKLRDGRAHHAAPHMRGNSIEEGTHPNVVAARKKFAQFRIDHPHKAGRKKTQKITQALLQGLKHEAIIDGKKSGITVAEAIANEQLIQAMRGKDVAVDRILDRTEGALQLKTDAVGARTLNVNVTFDRKPRLADGPDAV